MSVTEIKVLDPLGGTACYRGATYEVSFVPRCTIEVVVAAERVARCLDVMRAHLAGALELAVHGLDDLIRIRTGQHASRAA